MGRDHVSKFGQELYAAETLRAARALVEAGIGRHAAETIAPLIPLGSDLTRRRVASKLAQRLSAGASRPEHASSFVRMVAMAGDMATRHELLYFGAARADRLVGLIARDVLYPVLVENARPAGAEPDELALHRMGLLLAVEPMVTIRFVLDYAAKTWGFRSKRCILLALRILRQAGIARTQRMRGASGAVAAVTLMPHDITLATFLWCFLDEFAGSVPAATVDRVERSAFARTFVVPPSLVDVRLDQAEQQGLLKTRVMAGARRVVPIVGPEEVVERFTAA
jgi:hypothetical protein